MKIRFNVTGAERKQLVAAITEILNMPQKYLGAPTFAYEIGDFLIDKEGALSYDASADSEDLGRLLDGLAQRGYAFENPDRLVIELPKDGFSEAAIGNLEKLVISKAALIKKAIGVESLPIEQTDETLRFPWFRFGASPEEVNAYSRFVGALCAMSKEQKRVTAKEKPVDNEKYAFRCFLLRLGFIGEEYKAERKILLANLSGNGSFKSGGRKQEQIASAESAESAAEIHLEGDANDLAEALADAELIHTVNASFEEGSDDE